MKIGCRGKDLAVRLPKRLVEKFGLKVGETIDSRVFELAFQRMEDRQSLPLDEQNA